MDWKYPVGAADNAFMILARGAHDATTTQPTPRHDYFTITSHDFFFPFASEEVNFKKMFLEACVACYEADVFGTGGHL